MRYLLSRNPIDSSKEKLSKNENVEAIRLGIIAELDAINLYMQLADRVSDEKIRSVFLDIANEEKTHMGEFLELLKRYDDEQAKRLINGSKEVEELLK